ncbi:hypothetical protein KR084_010570, partial [Drosophila pseudotakahashii]
QLEKELSECKNRNASLKASNSKLQRLIAELKSNLSKKATELTKFKTKSNKNENIFRTKLYQFETRSKEDSAKINELYKVKIDYNLILENNGKLKTQISNLESTVKEDAATINNMKEKLAAFTFYVNNCQNDNLTLLNHSKIPNIKFLRAAGIDPFTALIEDIPSAGSGWMVIQRRSDGRVNFSQIDQHAYEDGFGKINGEFWLGNKLIHQLTTTYRHELYVELVDFDNVTAYARYDNFIVGSKDSQYKLMSLGSYSGNAGDAFRAHEKNQFQKWTFPDKSLYFWWNAANYHNLNGSYYSSKKLISGKICDGIWWGSWYLGSKRYTLKSCKMLIRPKLC